MCNVSTTHLKEEVMTPQELIVAYNRGSFQESPIDPSKLKKAFLESTSPDSSLTRQSWVAVFILNIRTAPQATLIYNEGRNLKHVTFSATRQEIEMMFARMGAVTNFDGALSRNNDFLVTGLEPLAVKPRVTTLDTREAQ